jgi:hypothetical protein
MKFSELDAGVVFEGPHLLPGLELFPTEAVVIKRRAHDAWKVVLYTDITQGQGDVPYEISDIPGVETVCWQTLD